VTLMPLMVFDSVWEDAITRPSALWAEPRR
jgi:hypothetical protein